MSQTDEYNGKGGLLRGWHLDKRFHIGNIFTLIVLAIAFATYVLNVEHKADRALNKVDNYKVVTEKELARERQARRDADKRILKRVDRTETRISNRLDAIHQALVRIEEKMYNQRENR